jgi:hypothetical protein
MGQYGNDHSSMHIRDSLVLTPVWEFVPDAFLQSLATVAGSTKASVKSAPVTSAPPSCAAMRFAFVNMVLRKLLLLSLALVARTLEQSTWNAAAYKTQKK